MPKEKRLRTPKREKTSKKHAKGEAEAVAAVDVSAETDVSKEIAAAYSVEEEENEAENAEDDVEVAEGEEAQAVEDAVEETPRRNKKRRQKIKRGKPVSTPSSSQMERYEVENAEDDDEVAEGEEVQAMEDAVEETPRRRNKKRRGKPVSTPSSSQMERKEVQIGGMIFMCNDVTKKDCFKYSVFGLPEKKKDLLQQVKKGMKLFLYDTDQKHLYGIYQATSRSGMNLVPEAFRDSDRKFPAQVRFRIYKDCRPLKESDFKEAIKDNYVNRGRFKPELRSEQVRSLMQLFRPQDFDGMPHPRNNRDAWRQPDARRGLPRDSQVRGSTRGPRGSHARDSARQVPQPAPPVSVGHFLGPAPSEVVREPLYARDNTPLHVGERLPADLDFYRARLGYISAASQIALAEAEGRLRYLENLYPQHANLTASRPLLRNPLNQGAEYQREMPVYSTYAGNYSVGRLY